MKHRAINSGRGFLETVANAGERSNLQHKLGIGIPSGNSFSG